MNQNQLVQYSNNSQVVTTSGTVESNCNGITFVNIGTDTVSVLGYPILQGQSLYLPANAGEQDITNYTVTFEQGVGTTPALLVLRKNY